MPAIRSFRGLNNVTDPLRLGLSWFTRADNVDITESGGVKVRVGRTLALACTPTGLYSTRDFSRLYVIDGGELRQVLDDMTVRPLAQGLGREAYWAEINDQVLYVAGGAAGIVTAEGEVLPWRLPVPAEPRVLVGEGGQLPAGQYRVCATFILPDGRETPASTAAEVVVEQGATLQISGIEQLPGCVTRVYVAPADSTAFQLAFGAAGPAVAWAQPPEALGQELLTDGLDPLPVGVDVIAEWRGRIFAAQYLPEDDKTVVWRSEPLAPHLWNLSEGFFLVSGRVHALAPNDAGLVVATDRAMHAYTPEGLALLASYGTVPGLPWALDGKRTLIWSQRGLCQFPEFTNLTASRVSVAPGLQAGAAVLEIDGQSRFLACLHTGGTPFNQRREVTP